MGERTRVLTHEGVDATHAMCARRSGCATGSDAPPNADAWDRDTCARAQQRRGERAEVIASC